MSIRFRSLAVVGVAALLLFGLGGVLRRSPVRVSDAPATVTPVRVDRLAASIVRAQDRLLAVPGDYVTWAALGSAYLERARVTADPAF